MKIWTFYNTAGKREYVVRFAKPPGSTVVYCELARYNSDGGLMRSQMDLTVKEAESIRRVLTEQGFNITEQ